jgi:hypothetical protein
MRSARKGVKTMKYETPQLTTLTPAINAVHCVPISKAEITGVQDSLIPNEYNENVPSYTDWED